MSSGMQCRPTSPDSAATVSVTDASGSTSLEGLGGGDVTVVTNGGPNTLWVKHGDANVVGTTTNSIMIVSGEKAAISHPVNGAATHLAYICASGETATLNIFTGSNRG